MIDDTLRAQLAAALTEGPALRFALVFGSVARGEARVDSDLDVAILPTDPSASLADEHRLADALERASGRPVDLVRIDHADDALLWRIARDGVVLVSTPAEAVKRWRAQVAIEHADWVEMRGDAVERYRAAVAAGRTSR